MQRVLKKLWTGFSGLVQVGCRDADTFVAGGDLATSYNQHRYAPAKKDAPV